MALRRLLRSWGLAEEIVNALEAQQFTTESLIYIGDDTINKLITLDGPRCLFKAKLEKYRASSSTNSQPASPLKRPASVALHSTSDSEDSPPPQKRTAPVALHSCSPEVSLQGGDLSLPLDDFNEVPTVISAASSPLESHLSIDPKESSVNDLRKLLKSNPEGVPILAYYNTFGVLNDTQRDELSSKVIYAQLQSDFNKRLGKDIFATLATQIVDLFPTESLVTWYCLEEKKGRTIVKGRLHHKFYNLRRYLIRVGLIQSSKLRAEIFSDEELDDDVPEIEDDDVLLWLKVHDGDFMEVVAKWQECADLRRILQRKYSIFEYIQKFAFLKLRKGWELLTYDCESKYPQWRGLLNSNWPLFLNFIEKQLERHSGSNRQRATKTTSKRAASAAAAQREVESNVDEPEPVGSKDKRKEEEVLKTVEILSSISNIFRPRLIPKAKGTPKSVPSWKPSRPETQAAFFLQCESGKLQETIESRRKVLAKFHHHLQPFVAAIGPQRKVPRQYLIVVDKQIWEASSALEALDACFKLFFAVNGCYPAEARHVWLLIQRAVYRFESEDDYQDDKGLEAFLGSVLKDFKTFLGAQ